LEIEFVNMAENGGELAATSGAILENVWASFIGGDGASGGTGNAPESCRSWEELPSLDGRDGSKETLQRLPSLGRWISMGAEAWEELLDSQGEILNLHFLLKYHVIRSVII
jgi:hypothetical protein